MTNASRTLLFDIHRQHWDEELLRLIRVPRALLPEVQGLAAKIYGETAPGLFEHPIPDRAAWPATSRPRSSARRASSRAC